MKSVLRCLRRHIKNNLSDKKTLKKKDKRSSKKFRKACLKFYCDKVKLDITLDKISQENASHIVQIMKVFLDCRDDDVDIDLSENSPDKQSMKQKRLIKKNLKEK